jgi:hypothetical protein
LRGTRKPTAKEKPLGLCRREKGIENAFRNKKRISQRTVAEYATAIPSSLADEEFSESKSKSKPAHIYEDKINYQRINQSIPKRL